MPSTTRSVAAAVLAATLLVATPGVSPADTTQAAPVEDYADYQPQTRCTKKAKPGTRLLAQWLVRRGGHGGPTTRPCRSGGTSEHKDGRAFDWMLDARRKQDRRVAAEFLEYAFATDADGNEHAIARRMGIMYVIWNDHMYSAGERFERENYLSSSCKRRKKCSPTLRHRNHMHISLSRKGGRGDTSWYDTRVR
jgi:hypothetical protein